MSGRPDLGLERLIHGLEQELLAAPDEEFVAGAQDLGMNPEMKGSAAFIGVKNYLSSQQLRALWRAHQEGLLPKAKDEDTATDPDTALPERSGTKRNADA